MREFGLEPDFDHLDRDLGQFGVLSQAVLTQLVAELDGEIVGSLILSRKSERVLKLSAFYVDSATRGKGIGKILLQNAVVIAKQTSYVSIYLETWTTMFAAVHLYKSMGWQIGEKLDPSTGAEWSYVLELN
ncbi:GNAT family N-acetyltransferase [Undibacterium sp. GrIS 1.2]